jgi:predicted DNA-binding transcriptional regulator YafY
MAPAASSIQASHQSGWLKRPHKKRIVTFSDSWRFFMSFFNTTGAESKGEKLAQRLSQILSRLHQGEAINKHALAQEFQVDVRTIERDLSERLGGIIERATNGQWQIKHAVRSNIPAKHLYAYARLSGTEHLFPDGSLPYLLEQLHTPEPQRTTQVHPVSHEDMQAYAQEFALLQAAITHKHPCHFAYKSKARLVYPYKLIHQNGVWYLAAEEDGRLKNFSISLIQALQLDRTQQFAPKREHTEYINGKEDVWFTEDTTEVLLRIAPEVAHYFLRRALLPHQQQRQDRDGSLLVSTHVNHMYQLLPVVRYWLPHVRILQPVAWHQELVASLRRALQQWGEGSASKRP